MAKVLQKHAAEMAKMNSKLNKQDSLAAKYFGVDKEMQNLKTQIIHKDTEIERLKIELKEAQANTSNFDKDSKGQVDQELLDYFGEGAPKKEQAAEDDEVAELQNEVENLRQQCDDYE